MNTRVAILGPLPDARGIGGVATHTARLAEQLGALGTAACVFDDAHVRGAAPGGADGVRGADALTRARLALSAPRVALADLSAVTSLGIPAASARARTLLLADARRRFSPDVVHVQQADFRPLYADIAGFAEPRVITVHGLGALETREYPGLAEAIPANLRRCDAVTTPSQALAREVEAMGIDAEKITVIPNGVDHDVFRVRDRSAARSELDLPSEAPLVVFAGRITVHKGAGDLSRAWPLLREAHPDARLAVVGPAGDASGSLPSDAVAPGGVDPERLALWMAAADVVVVPSRHEGFGLAALEAMACGRVVVASNIGGLPELISEATGALVPPGDASALAHALSDALSRPEWRRQAENAATSATARYSWQATAEAFAELYESLTR